MKKRILHSLKVSWDGHGINSTDEYASRIAKFQPDYLHLGPDIVRAVNMHEYMLDVLKGLQQDLEEGNFAERGALSMIRTAIAKAEGDK